MIPPVLLLGDSDNELSEAGADGPAAIDDSGNRRRRKFITFEGLLSAEVRGASRRNHIIEAADAETQNEHQEVQETVRHIQHVDVDAEGGY